MNCKSRHFLQIRADFYHFLRGTTDNAIIYQISQVLSRSEINLYSLLSA